MSNDIIGKTVTVTVDRALGTQHPKHPDIIYTVNYGYVEGIPAPDGEWQDAYILGVNEPVKNFTGKIIAVIIRENDDENKWVVAPSDRNFNKNEILESVYFQEKYFNTDIIM